MSANDHEPMTREDAEVARQFIAEGLALGTAVAGMLWEDRQWHRQRIRGDKSDVKRTGVTFEMVAAYAKDKDIGQGLDWRDPVETGRVTTIGTVDHHIVGAIRMVSAERVECFLDTLGAILEHAGKGGGPVVISLTQGDN